MLLLNGHYSDVFPEQYSLKNLAEVEKLANSPNLSAAGLLPGHDYVTDVCDTCIESREIEEFIDFYHGKLNISSSNLLDVDEDVFDLVTKDQELKYK